MKSNLIPDICSISEVLTVGSEETEVVQTETGGCCEAEPEPRQHQASQALRPELSLTANLQTVECTDAWQEEEDWDVPGVHADDEPEGGVLPEDWVQGGERGRGIDLDVVGQGGGVDQDGVVQQDGPAQYNSHQVNVSPPGQLGLCPPSNF